MEYDFLKKVAVKPLPERKAIIEREYNRLSIMQQCDLLTVHRSGLYYTPCMETEENMAIMRLLEEQYFKTPSYGIRSCDCIATGSGFQL